jgi:hypothetical protein
VDVIVERGRTGAYFSEHHGPPGPPQRVDDVLTNPFAERARFDSPDASARTLSLARHA